MKQKSFLIIKTITSLINDVTRKLSNARTEPSHSAWIMRINRIAKWDIKCVSLFEIYLKRRPANVHNKKVSLRRNIGKTSMSDENLIERQYTQKQPRKLQQKTQNIKKVKINLYRKLIVTWLIWHLFILRIIIVPISLGVQIKMKLKWQIMKIRNWNTLSK